MSLARIVALAAAERFLRTHRGHLDVITYPDVILGRWVGADADQVLARASVAAFSSLIDPTLGAAYAPAHGACIDVTRATGGYGPLEQTTTLAPYGVIPVPVAKVCELTCYCEFRDIHARTVGYKLVADLIAAALPKRHR